MRSGIIILMLFFTIPAVSWAADHYIEIRTTPRGIADEVIKIEEHKQRRIDAERERIRAEKAEEAEKLVRVAQTYIENGETETAVEYYEKALHADETNVDAHAGMMKAEKIRDEKEMEIGMHYHRAMVFLRKGLRQSAEDALVDEINANPDNQAARDKLKEIEGANINSQSIN